ncbi:MAG TPA: hypothetical protein V6D26_26430 [Stenomitos sp.]
MNIGENFKNFCNNLIIEEETKSTISDRYEKITQRLNKDFWNIDSTTENSLYVGSYGRRTAVRGFSDLDIIFKLPLILYFKYNNYAYNGQSALLQAVKISLQKRYPTTHLKGDGQVVSIKFTDKIEFEIVPAFEKNGGFEYPDSNDGGKWRFTNPKPEIKTIKDNHALTNCNLINLCRMTRVWRNEWNVPMGGLLIDTLANQFLINWEYKNRSYFYYDWMARDFFLYLSNQNTQQYYWKALGSGQHISRKGVFEDKAKRCYNLALYAIKCDSEKLYVLANKTWREIYGTAYSNESN